MSKDGKPVWLLLQESQLLEAQVRPAPPFTCLVASRGGENQTEHRFVGDSSVCVCGETIKSADGSTIFVTPRKRWVSDDLPEPAAESLTDEDVRRLEHPSEFMERKK